MKIYISGKITGLQKRDYRGKFKAAANRLRMLGHTAVDPSRLDVYDLGALHARRRGRCSRGFFKH